MIFLWPKTLHATLCVGRAECRVFWSMGKHAGSLDISNDEPSPKTVLEHASNALRPKAEEIGADARQTRWRICLAGGFYAPAQRASGRWSAILATAATTEFEQVCPVPLDELQTSAIPMNSDKAWVCGFDRGLLSEWKAAADELGIVLEGVWTHAATIVDLFLERGGGSQSLHWQDGFTRVELWPQENSHSSISRTRVYACREAAESSGIRELIEQKAPEKLLYDCPISALPGAALHVLNAIDSSESLNLLHGLFQSRALERVIQRPFAVALILCSIGCLMFALGCFVSGQSATKTGREAQAQLAASWRLAHGNSPLPALAATSMEQEVATWRAALREFPALDDRHAGVVAAWTMLIENLPKDLPVSVSSLRNDQREFWIEGQVKSQSDARKLESAWDSIAALKVDPIRLSAGSGGLVNFSIRMVLR